MNLTVSVPFLEIVRIVFFLTSLMVIFLFIFVYFLKHRLKLTTQTTREKIMVRIDGKSKLNGNMYTF